MAALPDVCSPLIVGLPMPTPPHETPPQAPDRSAREATVAIVVMVVSLIYSQVYCWLFGRIPDDGQVVYAWGIPAWVAYGIVAPWLVGIVIAWWFAYRFMVDEPWEADEECSSFTEGGTHDGR